MRRVGWLQAMLRDDTNHAQPLAAIFGRFLGKDFLEEKGGLCEGANLFAVAFHRDVYLFEGVTAQRSFTRLFRRMGSSGSSWHSLRRGRFFFFCDLTRHFFVQLVGQWPQG